MLVYLPLVTHFLPGAAARYKRFASRLKLLDTQRSLSQTELVHPEKLASMVGHNAETFMEQIANLHIEKLPEGVYLATSDDIPGLVAQGRTITETLEIARDVAKKLLEAQAERHQQAKLEPAKDSFDYPLILGT